MRIVRASRAVGAAAVALGLLGGGFAAGLGLGGLPGSPERAAAAGAQATPQTVQLVPAGPGKIEYAPAGNDPSFDCATGDNEVSGGNSAFAAFHCEQTYTPGQTVTIEAIPREDEDGRDYSFAGWSTEECGGQNPCRIVVPGGPLTISAIFTPAEFGLVVTDSAAGTGRVTATPPPPGRTTALTCTKDANPDCRGWYAAGTVLTITAQPGSGTFNGWHRNCAGTETTTCTVTTAGWGWASAAFNGAAPADIPDPVPARVNVVLRGATGGRIVSTRSPSEGEAINCPPTCDARFTHGEPVTLTATGTAQLSSWGSACPGAATTCRVHAGLRNPIHATFQTTTATTTQPPTSITTTTATTTSGTTQTTRRLTARLVRVAVRTVRGRRSIVATLTLSRGVTGRIVALRARRTLASKPFRLAAGRRAVSVMLRRGTRPGWTSLRITLRAAGGSAVTLRRAVRLR